MQAVIFIACMYVFLLPRTVTAVTRHPTDLVQRVLARLLPPPLPRDECWAGWAFAAGQRRAGSAAGADGTGDYRHPGGRRVPLTGA